MKIDFAILWVDDNKDFVESLRPHLTKWISDEGFTLLIERHPNEAGIFDDLKKKDIELIVLDYKLPKKTGDELIKDIRSKQHYQDIVFYAQGGIPKDLFPSPPDGVFFVDRSDARDRIKDLLELKIRRASDLATVRGWIVADSIELEVLLGNVLAKFFGEKELMFTERVLTHEGLFDFYKKHQVLSGILKDEISTLTKSSSKSAKLAELQKCRTTLNEFPDDIVHVRNALAHQTADICETGAKSVKTKSKEKKITFTPEKCAQIRKDIAKHRDNLRALQALL